MLTNDRIEAVHSALEADALTDEALDRGGDGTCGVASSGCCCSPVED